MNIGKVPSLQKLSLRRVCKDIVRHSIKYAAETDKDCSEYYNFQRMFADEVLEIIAELQEKNDAGKLTWQCPWKSYRHCLDFVFNKFLRKVETPCKGYGQEVIKTIARNCKDLWIFKTRSLVFNPNVYIQFLNSMKNLVVLDISFSPSLTVEVVEAIADSLTHLRSLSFCYTSFNDEGAFVLCGHKRPLSDSVPSCCFTGDCGTKSPLKLRHLYVDRRHVTRVGIACILTHIPTIENFEPALSSEYTTAQVICEIDTSRQKCGMSRPRMELRRLYCPNDIESLKDLFFTCPKLRNLILTVRYDSPGHDWNRDQALADSDLRYLSDIFFKCENTRRILTENFKRFWRTRGNQITSLFLVPDDSNYVSFRAKDLREIVSACPNLTHLIINRAILTEPEEKHLSLGQYPYLGNLTSLNIDMDGEPDSVVAVAFNIISAATNVIYLFLDLPVELETLFKFLLKQSFPHLGNIVVQKQDVLGCYKYFCGDKIVHIS